MNLSWRPGRMIALAASLALTVAASAEARELRGWNLHIPDYPGSVAMEEFATTIGEKTDGRYTGTVYHNGQLGDQRFAVEQFAFDGIDFAVFSGGSLGDFAPALNIVSMPYVFRSEEHMFEVLDGKIGERLSDALADSNMVALAWYTGGARSFYTVDKPVVTPADLKGLKIRVPDADIFVATVEALGANATPLAFGEVYTSLQTGVIDGAENNAPSFESTRHYEVAKLYSLDQHMMVPEALVVSKSLWDSLSPEDKEVFRATARASAETQRKLWAERVEKSKAVLAEAGVETNEIADKQPFIDAMQPVYDKFVTTDELRQLLADIQASGK
ncbi:TRAP transporter substrate-binding protein [Salipiger sp. PrR007]|uniref:TRAP transporter substrate-binding protein n=1 Tax=Salipiger sp. PrR007 TaxID=2706884 RepID=UPI0013BA152C|nr:TRAP transporter substrate-binding protein [Salipiger sp. PrR007]NDW33415.1 TRAP transporter substrate-binding protein [Salipiger sp. PrR007]